MKESNETQAHLDPPKAVREIAERLEEAGHETWAVGGAVRDALLGLEVGDWDLATQARPREVQRLFRRTIPIGIEHGTVGVLGDDDTLYEVTTFRRDIETFGRHAVVEFSETIDEDLARRDFTCNALAWHPLTGELRDPYHGMQDLEDHVLRTVGRPEERFAEDYLRILRALRFAGHFELEIDPPTWAALVEATPKLRGLSAERVREELWKVFENTRRASTALSLYERSGALEVLYPELDQLVGLETGREMDPWELSIRAVDEVSPTRPVVRMAALLHAVGMPSARARDLRGGWRFVGHEVQGARTAAELMQRLKASNAETRRTRRLVRHQADLFPPGAPGAGVRRWLRDIGPDLVRDLFRLRFALWKADPESEGLPTDLIERWRAAHATLLDDPALEVEDLEIGGTELIELGLEPGPRIGEVLSRLLEDVIDEPERNTRDRLLERAREEIER